MPQPRNLPSDVLRHVLEFAAHTAYAPSSRIMEPGRRSANCVFGRWIVAGIVMDYYGATASCAARIAGVTSTRATELVDLWRTRIDDEDRERIIAAWEKWRRKSKLPTRKSLAFGAAE